MTKDALTSSLFSSEFDPPDSLSERDADRERKRLARAEARDIVIPPVFDPARRERCRDPLLFLPTYFPHHFYLGFCDYHREIIAETVQLMAYGGAQAFAEPRGIGKTTILEFLSLYGVFYGLTDFLGYAAATHPESKERLHELSLELQQNERLREDFPEFVVPIYELRGAPQRAAGQTVNGELTHVECSTEKIVFPTIAGTRAQGQCIITRGIESNLRGVKHQGRRPSFWMIDDPQKRETALSPVQVEKLLDTIARDLGQGGDNRRKQAVVCLCTVIAEGDAADQLTDPEKNPAWNGKRRKLLNVYPDRMDLWERYIELYKSDQLAGDRFARGAYGFYLENRAAMDEGAVVAWDRLYFGRHMNYNELLLEDEEEEVVAAVDDDERMLTLDAVRRSLSKWLPDRFADLDDTTRETLRELNVLPDGTEIECSALQHCFNIIAEKGEMVFKSECQNEPVDVAGGTEQRLTMDVLCRKVNSLKRAEVPTAVEHITAFIDVHKTPLYFMIIGWEPDATGYILDYGTYPRQRSKTLEQVTGSPSTEGSIFAGIQHLTIGTEAKPGFLARAFRRDDGAELRVERCLVDSGWGISTDTVYRACRMNPHYGVIYPSKGEWVRATGKSLTEAKRKRGERKGLEWRLTPAPHEARVRVCHYDANYWKSFVHARLGTPLGERGSLSVFGKDARAHRELFEQLLSERAQRVHSATRGEVDEWRQIPNRPNHELDCAAGCAVGAAMLGVKFTAAERPVTARQQQKKSAAAAVAQRREKRAPQNKPTRRSSGGRTRYKY